MKGCILVFIVAISILSSCQKNGFSFVEGYVYAADTKEPIPNAKVLLSWTYGDHDWSDNDITDNKGYYKIKYSHRDNVKYYVFTYLQDHWGVNSKEGIINGNTSKVNIYMDPLAYVNFRFINNSANSYTISNYQSSLPIYFISRPSLDTLIPKTFKANGNGSTIFAFFKNGAGFTSTVNIYSRGDTVTHTVYIN